MRSKLTVSKHGITIPRYSRLSMCSKRNSCPCHPVPQAMHASEWKGAHLQAVFPLGSPDELAYFGHQHIHGSHGLAVLVGTHVERFDCLGVIVHDHWLLEHLLRQVALVLTCQVNAPFHLSSTYASTIAPPAFLAIKGPLKTLDNLK